MKTNTTNVTRFNTLRDAVAASGWKLNRRYKKQVDLNDKHEATRGALLLDDGTVLIVRQWENEKTISEFTLFADANPFNSRDNMVSVVSLKDDTLTHVGRMPLKAAQSRVSGRRRQVHRITIPRQLQPQTKTQKMKRTIIIRYEEHVDCNIVTWSAARGPIGHHIEVTEPFGLKWDIKRGPMPYKIDMKTTVEQLDERIRYIAAKHKMKVRRISPITWAVTHRIVVRKQHRFPSVSGDGTKWGPTDFYDEVRDDVLAAVRSGLDFSTDWISCKKEPVSCRITRELGITHVEVSVCGEDDAYGDATVTTQVHKHLTDDQILSRLERAGNKAWKLAEQELDAWCAEYGNDDEE